MAVVLALIYADFNKTLHLKDYFYRQLIFPFTTMTLLHCNIKKEGSIRVNITK